MTGDATLAPAARPLGAACRSAWSRARGRAVSALALGLAFALVAASPRVQADADTAAAEYRIKAAFLVKFLSFVEWPRPALEQPDAPFVIGVLGARTMADELGQAVAGRQIGGRPVQVRVLGRADAAAGLQVLFVGRGESARVPAIVAAAEGQPLLVVTESDDGLAAGGGINFVVVDDKVRFDIALRPIERAGLKISARLLAVARTVLPNPT
jgi:hypothetical protein